VRVRVANTVLFVDDEELVRTVAASMLETLGYRVILAQDGPGGRRSIQGAPGGDRPGDSGHGHATHGRSGMLP